MVRRGPFTKRRRSKNLRAPQGTENLSSTLDESAGGVRIRCMTDERRSFDVLGQLAGLRRYARALTRDPSDAEDLVHDALVRAYERRGAFRDDRPLRPWLMSILHNLFIDRARARAAETRRDAARAAPEWLDPPQEHAVRLSQVRRAFEALPDDQRAALHLIAVEGLSYEEAAAALGAPLGTVMSRISRARATLRALESDRPGAGRPPLRLVGEP